MVEQLNLEELLKSKGIKEVLEEALVHNNTLILCQDLSNGFEIARERTRIIDTVVLYFFNQFSRKISGEQDFILGAVGGYGRMESVPNSDVDIVLIANSITPQIRECSSEFARRFFYYSSKISGHLIFNTLDDIPQFGTDKIAALLDSRLLAGSGKFYRKVKKQLRQYTDSLEFILGMLSDLESQHKIHYRGIFDARSFNVKYGIGGLRHFQTGVWIDGIKRFTPSVEVYTKIPPDVIEAVGYMLKLRAWLNLRKDVSKPTVHSNDELTYEDRVAFREAFGEEGLEMVVSSRKIIRQFAESKIYRILKGGIAIDGGIEHGIGGLRISRRCKTEDQNTIFYRLMLHSQKRSLPIEPDTYHYFLSEASTFIRPDPAFLDFFYEKGSLASTLRNLSRFSVLGKILPGFSKLEAALYERGHRNWHITRAGQAVRRIENLESLDDNNQNVSQQMRFFMDEYKNLEPEQLFALRLALLCKGIPQVLGITTQQYTDQLHNLYPQTPHSALDTTAFLIENKDTLFSSAQSNVVGDPATVVMQVNRVKDARQLRSLLLFTYADLGYGKQKRFTPEKWENVIDLYKNTMRRLMGQEHKPYDPLALDEEGRTLGSAMPESFLQSRYVAGLVNTYIGWLRKVDQQKIPQIRFTKTYSDKTALLEIAAENFQGLLWRIAGMCYKHGMDITQAQIYSLKGPYKLALDFFNLAITTGIDEGHFKKELTEIISTRGDIQILVSDLLGKINIKDLSIEHLPEASYYRMVMSGVDQRGLLYAVTRTLSENVGVDIYATNAHTSRDGAINNVVIFKTDKPIQSVRESIEYYIRPISQS